MMFFEQVLEVNDQKRIVLRVLNMILNLFFVTCNYSFWPFFHGSGSENFAHPDLNSGKKVRSGSGTVTLQKAPKKVVCSPFRYCRGGSCNSIVTGTGTGTGTQHNNFYTEISTVVTKQIMSNQIIQTTVVDSNLYLVVKHFCNCPHLLRYKLQISWIYSRSHLQCTK